MAPRKRGQSGIVAGTFAQVVSAYLASDRFARLADTTRQGYQYILTLAQHPNALGLAPVETMRPALTQAFLDGFADRPAQQKRIRTVFMAVERWAMVRDLLPHSITYGTEAPGSKGGHVPWSDAMVALAEQYARPDIARIITLGANTGQRSSDLVKMRWTDVEVYEGRAGINVIQRKTGLRLWVPMTEELSAQVVTWEVRPTYLCLKRDGQPWTRHQLSDAWQHERDRNPALEPLRNPPLHMHGLRATAVVRLRRAGANTAQIADMVGMSVPMVTHYSRLSVQRENALAAVHYLDRTRPLAKKKTK
jgi:integrase